MKVDDLLKISSLIGGFLIFFGALYLHLYYDAFHIAIFRYIEFSDILVSFLNPLISIVDFFISLIVLLYVFPLIMEPLSSLIDKLIHKFRFHFRLPYKLNKQTVSNNDSLETTNKIWIAVYCLVCVFVFMNHPSNSSWIFLIWFVCIILSSSSIVYEIHRNKSGSLRNIMLNIIITFFLSTLQSVDTEIGYSKNENHYSRKIQFISDTDTISTNKTTFYVGKTSKYIFLYDTINQSTNILSTSKYHRITIAQDSK